MALNPRQAKFAELYHAKGNATHAYGEAYDVPPLESGRYPAWCAVEGHRLLRSPKVREELDRLRGEVAALADMTREELTDFLVAAITTPVGNIGPDSPLCEEYTFHRKPGSDEEEPLEVVKIKCVSKIGAIKELMRLSGIASPQKVEVSADSDVLAMIQALTGTRNESSKNS